MLTKNTYERYQRQVILKGFGESSQEKLRLAKVLVVGAGGLGCPVLQYLVAAGVGTIGIADHDTVQLSNLHRQVLYKEEDIGKQKATIAASVLAKLNPTIKIEAIDARICSRNVFDIVEPYDLVIDGSDNFATRYLLNDVCVLLDKPLVYGAVSSFEGQVAVFNMPNQVGERVNYRDLFPEPPSDAEVANCQEAGVLGVLPGIIGTMQANEAIKIITGLGEPLLSKILTYNSLNNHVFEIHIAANPGTSLLIPKDREACEAMDYDWLCNARDPIEIDTENMGAILAAGQADLVDVREEYELPDISGYSNMRLPLNQLFNDLERFKNDTIVLICQTGKRSLYAARTLKTMLGPSKNIYSVAGGIAALKQSNEQVTND